MSWMRSTAISAKVRRRRADPRLSEVVLLLAGLVGWTVIGLGGIVESADEVIVGNELHDLRIQTTALLTDVATPTAYTMN